MSRLLVIGCGGVAQVAIQKCCQNSETFTELMIASRTEAKCIALKEKLEKNPTFVIEHAVKGMLPKGPLGRQMYKKLFVYAGPDHKHQAQQPESLEIKY